MFAFLGARQWLRPQGACASIPKMTEKPNEKQSMTPKGDTVKLGYLIPQFPGQTHIFFWREISGLEAMGADVTLMSTRRPPSGLISHDWSDHAIARTSYLGEYGAGSVLTSLLHLRPWHWWRDIEGLSSIRDILICLPAARRMIAACRARNIKHVHVHSCGRAALIAALAQKMGGPSYSLTLHGPVSDYGPMQGFKWRGASFGTVITEKLLSEIRRDIGADLPDRLVVQPMGVDTNDLRRDTVYEPADLKEPIRLFSCARLNVVKGHQDLMAAVRILVDQGLNIQLDIAGEDDDGGNGFHNDLAARLHDLGLQDHVRLLGAISAQKVHEHLLKTHIFALASWHEPLGVAYMEAMSCGVPTIGTNAGGVPELIRDGVDGVLTPPQNPEALADAILVLIRNPDRAKTLAAAGRARILDRFHSNIGAECILTQIAALVGQK
ncbi:glycosyl transferase, group 1 family protein [Rhodobacteraceae bacterium HTCC2150]|nr:glycosyl transferase, group 1 family protein [Rhodobacteraceae bacterium HTCC2150]